MSDPATTLDTLRTSLAEVDQEIVRLAARRQRLAGEIGALKDEATRALRDFAQEKRVMERARRAAEAEGVPAGLADSLMALLIASSLTTQERQRVSSRRHGAGRRALVLGGAGRMGGWFARFLASQGFGVELADPAAATAGAAFATLADWRQSPLEHDLIVVAAPLRATAELLQELADRRPPGVIFDIGSLKSPLRPALQRLAAAGLQVTSLHPMFGPATELLSGRHVVLVDLGVESANAAARALFEPTMAEVVTMDLERHDRVIAQILGVSHALNIAFFTALAESGETAGDLARLSSTTFERQFAVAADVAEENPRLYYEIQRLNRYGGAALDALAAALERVREVVRTGDEAGFVGLMEQGRRWCRNRREASAAAFSPQP